MSKQNNTALQSSLNSLANNVILYALKRFQSTDEPVEKIFMRRLARNIEMRPSHAAIVIGPALIGILYREEASVPRSMAFPPDKKVMPDIISIFAQPFFDQHPVFHALRLAYEDEIYDAFEMLFQWAHSTQSDALTISAYWAKDAVWPAKDVKLTLYDKEFGNISTEGQTLRSLLLEQLWFLFHYAEWNNDTRLIPEEALAMALSKYYGSQGNYGRASYFVEKSVRSPRKSIHLKAAQHALHLRMNNEPVLPRLEKFIGYDNGYLKNFICEAPFKRFDIVETGEVNVCCGHWLPTSIGRIEQGSLDDILNSKRAQSIRRSMTDGSYKYCNHLECVRLAQNTIEQADKISDPVLVHAVNEQDFKVDHVDDMLFAYDQSCNLACPSCRRERIIEKPSENEAKARIMEEKLLPLLKRLKHITLNVAGEVFVSKPSRKMLEMVSPEDCPDLQIDLISNGMLFTEQEWAKFPGIHTKVRGVRISIDAARKDTFEKLRRFGIFEVLTNNLAFLKRLRQENKIKDLICSFTYQVDNFREMEGFVYFARSFGFDRVTFEPLQNVGAFTDKEFDERAVHKPTHPLFPEFLAIIQKPVFKQLGMAHDFSNYEGYYDNRLLCEESPILPTALNTAQQGMRFTSDHSHEAMELPLHGRHRIQLEDRGIYEGLEHFTFEFMPIGCSAIAVELGGLDHMQYGCIVSDMLHMRLVPDSSDTTHIPYMQLHRREDGMCVLHCSFRFTARTQGIYLNISLLEGRNYMAEYMGNPARGMRMGRIYTTHAAAASLARQA